MYADGLERADSSLTPEQRAAAALARSVAEAHGEDGQSAACVRIRIRIRPRGVTPGFVHALRKPEPHRFAGRNRGCSEQSAPDVGFSQLPGVHPTTPPTRPRYPSTDHLYSGGYAVEPGSALTAPMVPPPRAAAQARSLGNRQKPGSSRPSSPLLSHSFLRVNLFSRLPQGWPQGYQQPPAAAPSTTLADYSRRERGPAHLM